MKPLLELKVGISRIYEPLSAVASMELFFCDWMFTDLNVVIPFNTIELLSTSEGKVL